MSDNSLARVPRRLFVEIGLGFANWCSPRALQGAKIRFGRGGERRRFGRGGRGFERFGRGGSRHGPPTLALVLALGLGTLGGARLSTLGVTLRFLADGLALRTLAFSCAWGVWADNCTSGLRTHLFASTC